MKFSEFNSETQPARVGIIASQEVTQQIRAALPETLRAEINHLPWPVAGSLHPASASSETPDLVVCEINDPTQALTYRQEIGFLWPDATLIFMRHRYRRGDGTCFRCAGRGFTTGGVSGTFNNSRGRSSIASIFALC